MTRLLLAALALAGALSLAACNPADLSPLQGVAPTLTPGTLTPEAMTAAGIPAKTQTKILSGVSKVQAAAAAICPFLPLAEGVANIVIAQQHAGINANVQGVANLTCKALTAAPTYAALGSRRGELVKGHLNVGGQDIAVYGTRLR